MVILASSALAATPQVVLSAPDNYDISIDGRMYSPNPTTVINNLAAGTHTVEVYRVTSNGIFGLGKKREFLSRRQFNLRNSDVTINVDQSGRLRVSDNGYNNNDRNNDGRYGNRDRNDNDRYDNRDEKGRYGKSEGKGRGHKYGHYKKHKKDKYHKNKKNNDDRRDDDNRK